MGKRGNGEGSTETMHIYSHVLPSMQETAVCAMEETWVEVVIAPFVSPA